MVVSITQRMLLYWIWNIHLHLSVRIFWETDYLHITVIFKVLEQDNRFETAMYWNAAIKQMQ